MVGSVPADPSLPRLGPGETVALSLARREGVRFVLLDEKKARRIAASVGLLPVGTLAVLLRAKERGLIPEVRQHLTALQAQGRHLSPNLIARVLRDAGELP